MCRDINGKQQLRRKVVINQLQQGVEERPVPITRSATRDQEGTVADVDTTDTMEPMGTIVQKRFNDGKFYKGEVTKYDPINNYYMVRFQDGDVEEYDHDEMKRYKKKQQRYSKKQSRPTGNAYMLGNKYDENIFFIPTKACPNPVKTDYCRQQAAFMVTQRIDELLAKSRSVALSASGRVYDDELDKLCSYRELINHSNPRIRNKWLRAGENEFGRLFQGFKPNNIEGLGVLDWIN